MPAMRNNRFKRPGRSFHPFHPADGATSDSEDIELGSSASAHDGPVRGRPWAEAQSHSHLVFDETLTGNPDNGMELGPDEGEEPPWTGLLSPLFFFRKPTRRNETVRATPAWRHPQQQAPSWSGRKTRRRRRQRSGSRCTSWRFVFLIKTILMSVGLLQCLTFVCGILEALLPDTLDLVAGPWKDSLVSPTFHSTTPGDGDAGAPSLVLTANVKQPLMCHSHNDYWRREPLFDALRAGCTGVEADLWHFDDELYVAHTISGVRRNRTLQNMYLDPLKEILDRQNTMPEFLAQAVEESTHRRNGVFDAHPKQSLVLLIDFKNDPEVTWTKVSDALSYFRERRFLTYYDGTSVVAGPLTVVVSGEAPFERIVDDSTYRDIFYDAPLDLMGFPPTMAAPFSESTDDEANSNSTVNTDGAGMSDSGGMTSAFPSHPDAHRHENGPPAAAAMYSPANSYYASVSFMKSIGYPWHSSLTQAQLDLLRRQIRGAHARGLKVRYWGIPPWPVGLRNYLWRVLVREGVDYLSVDDVDAVTRDDWGPRKGGWGKKFWR